MNALHTLPHMGFILMLHLRRNVVNTLTVKDDVMVLLHGFKKKTQKTPDNDLKIAKERRDKVLKG